MKRSFFLLSLLAVSGTAMASPIVDTHSYEEFEVQAQYWEDWETGEEVFAGYVADWGNENHVYHGFTYNRTYPHHTYTPDLLTKWEWNDDGRTSPAISGEVGVLASSSAVNTISRATPFNFVGGDFTSNSPDNEFAWYSAQQVKLSGYLGETLVGSFTLDFTPGQVFSSTQALMGIDRLVLLPLGGENPNNSQLVYDNLQFTELETQAVPEPASMAALGLGGLALLRRRRKA